MQFIQFIFAFTLKMKRLHSSVAVQNNHSHLIHSSVIDWQSSRRPAVSLTVNVRKLKNRNFCKKHQHVQNTEINFELQKILNSSSSINVIEIFDEMSRGFRDILYDILHLVLYLNFSFLWWMRLDEFWIKKYFNFKFLSISSHKPTMTTRVLWLYNVFNSKTEIWIKVKLLP